MLHSHAVSTVIEILDLETFWGIDSYGTVKNLLEY